MIKEKELTLPYDKIFNWMKDIIFGLDYLNSLNFIHRDIKPEYKIKYILLR